MDSEATTRSDTDPANRLPWWPAPFGFLAYFLLFYYFANSGQTFLAMAFGFVGLPVFIFAASCCIAVFGRLIFGGYRNRLSWLGLLAWVGVAAVCVTMAILVLR